MARDEKTVNLALQGGGAHGAFTWGVLDQLLEDGRIDVDGLCGTSAGAMNAVVYAWGKMSGDKDGAREALHAFWERVSRVGTMLSPVRGLPADAFDGGGNASLLGLTHWWFESFARTFSPYQFNPFNINPLRDVLASVVDFEQLKACECTNLFLCATNVRTGKVKVFRNPELSADAVLASACLPFLFQAVEIDGEHYWDGGYMGNPVLYPLFYHTKPRDIVIVHINPIHRERLPRTAAEIANRVNEISFNSSLMREMRAVEFAARMVDEQWLKPEFAGRLRRMLVHSIRCDATTAELSVSSKLSPDWTFLTRLRDRGRATAAQWLARHYDSLGRQSTVDIRSEFLE